MIKVHYLLSMLLFSSCFMLGSDAPREYRWEDATSADSLQVRHYREWDRDERECKKCKTCLGKCCYVACLLGGLIWGTSSCEPYEWPLHQCAPLNTDLSDVCFSMKSSVCGGSMMTQRITCYKDVNYPQGKSYQQHTDDMVKRARINNKGNSTKASHCIKLKPCI